MQDEVLRAAARRLMLDEQAPTLSIEGVDLTGYADGLLERFSNPALKHRTWQIAMDGSQKLPQRMLDGIRVHLARGSRWPLLALGVAGWMRYVSGVDDAGQPIDVRDPLAEKIHALVAGSNEQERVSALLSLEEIFGNDLPHSAEFVANVTSAWRQLSSLGAREAIAAALDS
jgi:fructuronate reductase